MSAVAQLHARQILDSRGNPTVEVDALLESGAFGRAAVPSGASTGEHEAVELRDGGAAYGGKGVEQAVAHVNGEIAAAVRGRDAADQAGLDRALIELDGTPTQGAPRRERDPRRRRSRSRARTPPSAGVPLWRTPRRRGRVAAADADDERAQRRRARRQPGRLPGVHDRPGRRRRRSRRRCGWAPRPTTSCSATLRSRGLATGVGDEGGFAPALHSNEAPLELLTEAIEAAGYRPGEDVAIALDPASSEFYSRRRLPARRRGPHAELRRDGRPTGRR